MTEQVPGTTVGEQTVPQTVGEQLRELHAAASALVGDLPGPLRRIAVRSNQHAVEVEWRDDDRAAAVPPAGADSDTLPALARSEPDTTSPAPAQAAGDADVVRAPLVGTFHSAPQPGAEPFVTVGDAVQPGQMLAIVEAMKLMNPIVAEAAGVVLEIVVANGDAVEFDQPLMRIAVVDGEDHR